MVVKMRWIDEFKGLDGMNAGLTQQWLLTADCSTPWRQRQEMLGHPVTFHVLLYEIMTATNYILYEMQKLDSLITET